MFDLLVWLIKFPFVLVGAVLALVFGLVGGLLALLGAVLTPVLGVGLILLPIAVAFLLAAAVISSLFKRKVVVRYH